MTLADIMKVTGKKLDLSFPPGTHESSDPTSSGTGEVKDTFLSKWEPDVRGNTPSGTGEVKTTFLSKWEADMSAKVGTFRPSIHHFCTHPKKPQLPMPLLVLSRVMHTKPGVLRVRKSQDTSIMEVTISNSVAPKQERSLTTVGSTKCTSPVSFATLANNKRRLSTSRHSVRGSFLSSSETLNKEESSDIVSLAKARLRREKMAKDTSQECPTLDGKRTVDESSQVTKEGVRSKSSQSSRESASMGGQRSGMLKAEKLPCVEEGNEDGMHISGTRVQVIDNPGRYACACVHVHVKLSLCYNLYVTLQHTMYM